MGGRSGDLTLPAALASRATADPEGTFLIFQDEAVTFGEMETRAEALAASLHGLGIEPGDRVAVVMPSWPEFVISMFAVAKLGAVLVPLNPRLTADDLRYTLRHSEAVAAITAEGGIHLTLLTTTGWGCRPGSDRRERRPCRRPVGRGDRKVGRELEMFAG